MALIPLMGLLLLLLLLAVGPLPTTAEPLYQICSGVNYTANSAFSTNLNRLLSSLPVNGSATGFFDNSVGSVPDRVHGLVLCRGDVSAGNCRSCLATAAEDILQACPYRRSAVIWYDYCMLRLKVYMWNANNLTEVAQFNLQLNALMTGLESFAAYNQSARMFATGDADYGDASTPKIYGLVQCTRDQSADDCNACLKGIIGEIPKGVLAGKRGGRILKATCNFRYELYSFYNSSAMVSVPLSINATSPAPAPQTPAAAPPPPTAGIGSPISSPVTQEGKKKKNSLVTVLAIAVPSGSAVVLIAVISVCFCRRKSKEEKLRMCDTREISTVESLLFDLSTLRVATANFSDQNKLGQGGFGSVYKGLLPNGREIAVKRLLAGSGQGVEELKNEVVLLAKLQHRNLVKLLGLCLEGEEKLLVYEYVINSSLDKFLFDPTRSQQLNWETRYKIIGGIARGLQYLHEDSQVKIIHRDLKASNVLLDGNMNSKISDFGLARLFDGDQTQACTTRVVGTYGYMAPEYAMRGRFSNKSDVFSFGVLVLEILTGQRNCTFSDSAGSTDLLSYVWTHWTNGTVLETVDPSLGGQYQRGELMRCVQIGLLCVQEAAADRPTMTTAVLMLSSYSVSLQLPSKPAFFAEYSQEYLDVLKRNPDSSTSTKSEALKSPYSLNDVSITELYPR
ncbi:hypothetical protein Taro_055556 [Colocasia esculenta]|uniref:Cysteine-rich receptor-like protein kinase 10 n=1 Tax=Colocasia esculenta TaxID=4460 RepID=A0A843XTM5_COLES|nr:hypothetical protein [Colocasia esculenta]